MGWLQRFAAEPVLATRTFAWLLVDGLTPEDAADILTVQWDAIIAANAVPEECYMKVFIHGSEGRPPGPEMVMFVCPAGDTGRDRQADVNPQWIGADGKPESFTVEFRHGEATVEPTLGKYMIDRGLAHRTKLVMPGLWN